MDVESIFLEARFATWKRQAVWTLKYQLYFWEHFTKLAQVRIRISPYSLLRQTVIPYGTNTSTPGVARDSEFSTRNEETLQALEGGAEVSHTVL